MEMVKAIINNRFVYYADGKDILYIIPIEELGQVAPYYRVGKDPYLFSYWVFELAKLEWEWVTSELLMELCHIIKNEVPKNDIDWEATEVIARMKGEFY
jgi:hypothetical protein